MTVIDLSLQSLFYSSGYAITGQFDGLDLVNGGKHRATDVGNFGMDDPIKAPGNLRARGLYHFDTAIGIEYELGDGWSLELWHLNATLGPLSMVPGISAQGPWIDVLRGTITGRTGNSGALVNGQPMPAHTHIVLENGGVPFDVEPYLLGQPFNTAEDDMRLPDGATAMAQGVIGAGVGIRTSAVVPSPDPNANLVRRTDAETSVAVMFPVLGQGPYADPNTGKTRTDWLAINDGTPDLKYVAAAYYRPSFVTDAGKAVLPLPVAGGFTQAQIDAARNEGRSIGFSQAKTKAIAAVEAIEP